jgi:tripartite-type tricarboxylate transporter receptor subunit TctC
MARALAQELTKLLVTTVIVENRPGAGGGLSVQVVARADPDGHTLLFNSLSEHKSVPAKTLAERGSRRWRLGWPSRKP